jgi:hypothetical protein
MPYKFNPFTNALDYFESGGGGGASYIDGEVATYTDLPLDGSAALNTAWLVRQASGTWLIARKPAGIYIRTATGGTDRDADWTYAGILPDVFNDANFLLYDNGDSSKNLAFQLSGITTGTTRTLTVPDASGTIALLSNFLGAFKDAVVLAPSGDMSVTSSTTLADITGMSWTAAANTSYLCACAWQVDCGAGGFQMVLDCPSVYVGGAALAGYGFTVNGSNSVAGLAQGGASEVRAGNRGAAQTGPVFSIFGFRTDSTGGTAKFRFAQNGSNAAASVLKAQSRVLVLPLT